LGSTASKQQTTGDSGEKGNEKLQHNTWGQFRNVTPAIASAVPGAPVEQSKILAGEWWVDTEKVPHSLMLHALLSRLAHVVDSYSPI
jgi:hypothetical protein